MRSEIGRTSNGASIMPTNTCTAAPSASAPPGYPLRDAAASERGSDPLQHAPIEQQRSQCADRQHQRECLEGENEVGARMRLREWQWLSAEIAEYESGAGLCGILHVVAPSFSRTISCIRRREIDQQQCQNPLQDNAGGDDKRQGMRRRSSLSAEQVSQQRGQTDADPRIRDQAAGR